MFRRLTRLSASKFKHKATTLKLWRVPVAAMLGASAMTFAIADSGSNSDKCSKGGCKEGGCKGGGCKGGGCKKGGCRGGRCCRSRPPMRGHDINQCQNLMFRWFAAWDKLVTNNNDETQKEYIDFVTNNFDDKLDITVRGDGWNDLHKKDSGYLDFQLGLAEGFSGSYSVISPLCFISYSYCNETANEYATFKGTALGHMPSKTGKRQRRKGIKSKMMTTHQSYEVTFIKRAQTNKWRLYKQVSDINVLELSDVPQ
eukprot:107140_1